MRDKWHFDPLTDRDRYASSFEKVFSRKKRDWPELTEPDIKTGFKTVDYNSAPLNGLQRSILTLVCGGYVHRMKLSGAAEDDEWDKLKTLSNVGEAMDYIRDKMDA